MVVVGVHEQDEVAGAPPARGAVLRRIATLFRPHGRTLAIATAFLLATTALQLAGPLLIRRAIDVDILGKNPRGLLLTVAAYVAVQAVFLALNYLQRVRLEIMGQDIILGLRERLFAHLLSQPLSFFDRNPVGRLIARVQGDTDALRQMFASTVVSIVEALVLFLGMLAVMASVDIRLTLVVAVTVPPMALAVWVLAAKGAYWFRELRRRAADISAYVAEQVQGVAVLQAFSREADSVRTLDRLNRAKFRTMIRAEFYGIGLFQLIFLFELVGLVLVLWFGGRWAIGGAVTIGTLFMFIEYLRRLFDPIMRLSEQLGLVQRAVAAAGRVLALIDLSPAIRDPDRPVRWDGFRGEIAFEKVWFSYLGNEEWALRDVSLRIPKGEKWAIVGATGGGKSSLLSLLLRFYDPQRGTVRVDGIDVRDLAQADLRRKMALVLQDVYLFPGDVLSNLAPDGRPRDASGEAALVRAAQVAGAAAFIERLPESYRTQLAERGANLSAGERQMLSFARALAADPAILLLDEATASVDPGTEASLQKALHELLAGRTAIIIAHRLSTIRDCDGILVVADGRIAEVGRHEELLAKGGLYADLHALQFRDAAPAASEGGDGAGTERHASGQGGLEPEPMSGPERASEQPGLTGRGLQRSGERAAGGGEPA